MATAIVLAARGRAIPAELWPPRVVDGGVPFHLDSLRPWDAATAEAVRLWREEVMRRR